MILAHVLAPPFLTRWVTSKKNLHKFRTERDGHVWRRTLDLQVSIKNLRPQDWFADSSVQ
jgi:hypothetical protein